MRFSRGEQGVILFSLLLLVVGVWVAAYQVLSYEAPPEVAAARFEYSSLCPGPLFSPAYSFGVYFAVRDGRVNVSVDRRVWVLRGCRSFDGSLLVLSENIK